MNSHLLPLFTSYWSSGEKLIKYQVNSSCVIMSVILMTTLFYKALILQGEIWCWSLLGLKRLKFSSPSPPRQPLWHDVQCVWTTFSDSVPLPCKDSFPVGIKSFIYPALCEYSLNLHHQVHLEYILSTFSLVGLISSTGKSNVVYHCNGLDWYY